MQCERTSENRRKSKPGKSPGDEGDVFRSFVDVHTHECWCARERMSARVPAVCFYMRAGMGMSACFVLQSLCARAAVSS